MSFAHVQLLLYRPFLHYVSVRSHSGKLEPSSQACAAACVHVSRNIIHITASMNQNGLLVGSYWFTIYTTFFAILSLVFYALENTSVSQEIMRDAIVGRQTLAALAKRSMAADRCTATLTVSLQASTSTRVTKQWQILFDQITKKLNEGNGQSHNTPSAQRPETQFGSSEASSQAPQNRAISAPDKSGSFPTPSLKSNAPPLLAPRPRQESYTPGIKPGPPRSRGSVPMPQHYSMQGQLRNHQHPSVQMMPFSVPTSNGAIHPEAPQFSNMIFPSSDPMAYPNQPMLSLDQSGAFGQAVVGSPSGTDGYANASTAPTQTVHADEFVDMNILGMQNVPREPDQMQLQQHQQARGTSPYVPNPGALHDPDQAIAEPGGVSFPGLDFNDFFGAPWGHR